MKKVLSGFLCIAFSLPVFSQQMHVKTLNYTSFNTDKKVVPELLAQRSSPSEKKHPEYGILPFNAQCYNCAELIDKRTIDSRQFIDTTRVNYIYSQQSYFPLHFKRTENDIWRTIDYRLRPDQGNPKVFVANNQPVPTKCDLNKKTTSLTERGFEFEFNKNLSLYFFDENNAYTDKEKGSYLDFSIGEGGLHVSNMWTGIDMEQQFKQGEIKTNYVIKAPLLWPISKGYMVIEDHFSLPDGYTFNEESPASARVEGYYQGSYELRDPDGKPLIIYGRPAYYDSKSWGIQGLYKLIKTGNDYTLQMLINLDWLVNPDNTFPLIIDPSTSGITKIGNFHLLGNSANNGFTTKPQSCNYHMSVIVPGKTTLTKTYVDIEDHLTYDNMCGSPPLPSPFCQLSQITHTVLADACNIPAGLICRNDPNDPLYRKYCTTDSNLVAWAAPIYITAFAPNFLTCIPPQCPDYSVWLTLQNRDSTCGDVCGYLCAINDMWQTTIEACYVEGTITQDRNQVCAGEPVVFTAHPRCGVPPYHYAWSVDGGNTFDTIYNTPNLTVHPQTDMGVFCYIYDTCEYVWQSNDLSVTVIPSPSADAGADVHLCAGGNVTLGGNPTTDGATILWTGENLTVQSWLNNRNIMNPVLTVPAGTVDTFFYVAKGSNSTCFRNDTVLIFSSPAPMADAGPDISICAGGTVILGGNPASNTTITQWTGENSTVESWLVNASDANPTANIPVGIVDTFFYVLTATSPLCFKTDTVKVFSNPSPLAEAGGPFNLCEGGTIDLGGNPTSNGGSILWTGQDPTVESWLSSTTDANPQAIVPAGTIGNFYYVVKAFDPLCFRTDTALVFSRANPIALIDSSGTTRICANQSVTLTVSGNYPTYHWNNGSVARAITVNQPGNYYVVVTDAFGCKDTSGIISVTTIPVPTVQVYPDTLITFGDSVMLFTDINLSAASIDSFNWYPTVNISCTNCNNPVVTPENAFQYYGVNVYSGGCVASDSALIRVIFPNNFFIPNAFTPNGDGNNDDFYIKAQSGVRVLLFQVFDRWGEKVHEGPYPWDGRYKGKASPPGVYVYIFKLGLFGDEQSVFRKGSVTIIK